MGKQWWYFALIIVILSAVTGRSTLLLVGILLALVAAASALWKRYSLAAVSYERRFDTDRLFLGEETTMTVSFTNAKPLPLAWLISVDELPAQIKLSSGEVLSSPDPRRQIFVNNLSLRWYERVNRRHQILALQRGVWHFGPLQLSSGDIFGFSVSRINLPAEQTIVIYPKMVPLTGLRLADWRPFGDFRTSRRILTDPLRLMGAREYVPGDNFRHIHWKATARRRVLQTKVFEPSASREIALFLNVRTSAYVNEGVDRDVLELAIITAASIARWSWDRGYPVGLFANTIMRGIRSRIHVRPSNRADQLFQILDALARVEDVSQWTMATLLGVEAPNLRFGSSIVIISPILSTRLKGRLLALRQREFSVTLITLGKASPLEAIPGVQWYHLGDDIHWQELETLALAE